MIYLITFVFVYLAVFITYYIATEYPEPLSIKSGEPVRVIELPDSVLRGSEVIRAKRRR